MRRRVQRRRWSGVQLGATTVAKKPRWAFPEGALESPPPEAGVASASYTKHCGQHLTVPFGSADIGILIARARKLATRTRMLSHAVGFVASQRAPHLLLSRCWRSDGSFATCRRKFAQFILGANGGQRRDPIAEREGRYGGNRRSRRSIGSDLRAPTKPNRESLLTRPRTRSALQGDIRPRPSFGRTWLRPVVPVQMRPTPRPTER